MKVILLTLLLLSIANGYFGVEKFHGDLDTEERGIPSNLAFLLAYSDAVVITDHDDTILPPLVKIKETLIQKNGLQLKKGEVIHINSHQSNYFDNKREIFYDHSNARAIHEGQIVYYRPRTILDLPTEGLYFIRLCKVSDRIKLDLDIYFKGKSFKATNGAEGQVLLNEEVLNLTKDTHSELNLKLAKRQITEQKERWKYGSTKGFVDFVKAYYSEAGLNEEQLESTLGKRLQRDALELVKSLSKDKIPDSQDKEK